DDLTSAGRDSEPRREADELGHRAGLHLRHQVAALLLEGGLAGSQLAGDLLVEETGDDPGQHVALARSQGRVAPAELGALLTLGAHRPVTLDGTSDGVQQLLRPERLRQ